MPRSTRKRALADETAPLWNSVIGALQSRIPAEHLARLTDGRTYVELDDGALYVALPADEARRWLASGTIATLCEVVPALSGGGIEVAIAPFESQPPSLSRDPSHTLDAFIRSPANDGAWKVADQILSGTLLPPGPIVLCGPEGSGKTHLLDGIAHALAAKAAQPTDVSCQRADALSIQLVQALWDDALECFRDQVLDSRALLVDALETLSGRDGTQDELARALLGRARQGRLVVLALETQGGVLPPLGKGLSAALERGTIVDMAATEWELRVAILMDRAGRWGVELSPEAASFLIGRLGASPRGVDALLTRLVGRLPRGGGPTELAAVRRALDPPGRAAEARIPASSILGVVARHFGLRLRDMSSSSRSPRISIPRQIAMYLVRRHCGLSFPEIGQRFGRHHTTVLHACRRVESLLDGSGNVATAVRLIEKEIEALQNERG